MAVSGTANLAGTLSISLASEETFSPSTTYTVLTAGTIENEFQYATATGYEVGVSYVPSGTPTSVQIILTPIAPSPTPSASTISLAGLVGNSAKLASYLNSVSSSLGSAYTTLVSLSGTSLEQALESISPARNAALAFFASNTLYTMSEILSDRLNNQRFVNKLNTVSPSVAALFEDPSMLFATMGNPAKTKKEDTYSVWADGFGELYSETASDQNPAFHANAGGLLIGFDYAGNPSVIVGGGIGYARNSVHQAAQMGNDSTNFYLATAYFSTQGYELYCEAAIWGAYNQYETARNVVFPGFDVEATASHQGAQITSHLGAGYDWAIKEWVGLEPFMSLDWVVNFEEGFTEHGAGVLNMTEAGRTSSMLRSQIGLNVYQSLNKSWGGFYHSRRGFLRQQSAVWHRQRLSCNCRCRRGVYNGLFL